MVNQLMALTKSGLKDWFLQRLSALILLAYVIFLTVFFGSHPEIDFKTWCVLFEHPWMKILSLLVLLSLLVHAWVGIWTVLTDYIHCAVLRGSLQFLIALGLFSCLVWGVLTVWG